MIGPIACRLEYRPALAQNNFISRIKLVAIPYNKLIDSSSGTIALAVNLGSLVPYLRHPYSAAAYFGLLLDFTG